MAVRNWIGCMETDWYDFGARPYDGVVGGFLTIDPFVRNIIR